MVCVRYFKKTHFISLFAVLTSSKYQTLVSSLNKNEGREKDKSKFFEMMENYQLYKSDYAKPIKFDPNMKTLSIIQHFNVFLIFTIV